jgi:hypothetical protein
VWLWQYWYDAGASITDWAVAVADAARPPAVYSVSYGVPEAYLTAGEMEAFDTEALKLAAQGALVG